MSFFSRKKNQEPAPEWTPFATMNDYDKFIRWVKEYFDKKKIGYILDADLLTIQNGDWPTENMGLSNLAQICNQNPQGEWESIVTEHFEGFLRGEEFETAFNKQAHDYSFASPYIGVRIYPNGYLSYLDEDAYIKRPLTDDLSFLLVLDLPHTVINLNPERTQSWNKTEEQLFEIGLANVRMNYRTDISLEDLGGAKVWILQGNHFFVANSLLDLHLYDIPASRQGYIVAIPHRHAALVYPITDLSLFQALPTIAYVAREMFNEGPGSISEELYWLKDGRLINQAYKIEENEFNFTPTDGFMDMVNTLPASPQ